jgi:hypothetical protein
MLVVSKMMPVEPVLIEIGPRPLRAAASSAIWASGGLFGGASVERLVPLKPSQPEIITVISRSKPLQILCMSLNVSFCSISLEESSASDTRIFTSSQ